MKNDDLSPTSEFVEHRNPSRKIIFEIPSLLIPETSMLEVLWRVARSLCVGFSGNQVYNPPQVLAF